MSEMPYGGTGTAEAAATPDVGDSTRYDDAGLGRGYDGETGALAAEDQLPARQDSRAAAWGDNPEYDEADLGAEYDGDLDALTAEDQLPARQDSRAAAWGDRPEYDEDGLDGGYDGDLDALTAEDQMLDAGDGHALDGTAGDQDQAAVEVPPAPGKPDTGIQPGEAAQPADSNADPEAELKELKAEYEASLKDLKTELQALKDLWGPVPDAPGDAGREADQPYKSGWPVDQKNQKEVRPEGDRPGLWSNAKYALYGAVGTTVGMALLDQFVPGVSRVVDDIIVGVPTVIGALVPTLREGWKRKHDDSPDKR